jgi:hypothetical protein
MVFLVFFLSNANGQCPSGYTQQTKTYSVRDFFNSSKYCDWEVTYCFKCGPSGLSAELIVSSFRNVNADPDCIFPNGSDIMDALTADVRSLCTVPDCGSGCLMLSIITPACWQYHYTIAYESGVMHQYSNLFPGCSSGNCVTTSGICYDAATHKTVICSPRISTLDNVTCSIPLARPIVWPDGSLPMNDVPFGDCYLVSCP